MCFWCDVPFKRLIIADFHNLQLHRTCDIEWISHWNWCERRTKREREWARVCESVKRSIKPHATKPFTKHIRNVNGNKWLQIEFQFYPKLTWRHRQWARATFALFIYVLFACMMMVRRCWRCDNRAVCSRWSHSPNAIFQLGTIFPFAAFNPRQTPTLTFSHMHYCCGRQQPGNILIYINLNIEITSDKNADQTLRYSQHHTWRTNMKSKKKRNENVDLFFETHKAIQLFWLEVWTGKNRRIKWNQLLFRYMNTKNGANKQSQSKPNPLRAAMNERRRKKK